MTSNIEKRLAALEAQLGEHEQIIPLIFPDWASPGAPTVLDLAAPPDADGWAWISPYYSVKFWGGHSGRVAGGTRPAAGGPRVSTSQPVGVDRGRLAPAARTGGPGDGAECLTPIPRLILRTPCVRRSRPTSKQPWWSCWPRPSWPN
jgi:hypothetical protein